MQILYLTPKIKKKKKLEKLENFDLTTFFPHDVIVQGGRTYKIDSF